MSEQRFGPSAGDDRLAEDLASALGHDPDRQPPPDRVAALRAAAEAMARSSRRTPSREAGRRARRRAAVAGGLAAGFGGVVGYLTPEVDPERTSGASSPTARAFPAEATGPDGDEPPAPV